jgi:hypothetical protein
MRVYTAKFESVSCSGVSMSAEGVGREDLTEARRHGERAWEKWTEFTEFFGEGAAGAQRAYGRGNLS